MFTFNRPILFTGVNAKNTTGDAMSDEIFQDIAKLFVPIRSRVLFLVLKNVLKDRYPIKFIYHRKKPSIRRIITKKRKIIFKPIIEETRARSHPSK